MIPSKSSDGSHRVALRAAKATRADSSITNDFGNIAAGELAVAAYSHRHNVDAAEHERQNRLKRWQTPANPTRKA